jgi:hypothetical protein
MRYIGLSLLIAGLFSVTACSGKTSSNSSAQSDAAATAAAGSNAAATMAAASANTNEIPSYPGATTQASGSSNNMGESASGSVMMSPDSFDKVYSWYQQHMPAGSEKSHVTAPVETAVFVIGDTTTGQKSVTITTQGSQTMITTASVKQ